MINFNPEIHKERVKFIFSICFVLLSGIIFTCGMLLTKLLSPSISSSVILFFRCFFGFIFFLPFILKKGLTSLKTKHFTIHILRVILICIAMQCTFYAYQKLPLSLATAIGFTSPLFTTLFAYFFLKEDLNYKKWIAIVMGYVGVLMMSRSFSFTFGLKEILIAFLANILASSAIIITKKLSSIEPIATLLFYSTLGTFILSTLIAILRVREIPHFKDTLLLSGIAVCGVLSNLFYIQALKYGKVSLIAPFEYVRLIFAAGMGYLFFQETFEKYMILGVVIIACSTFFLTRLELLEKSTLKKDA